MATAAQRLAALALTQLQAALAEQGEARHEGPAFEGSSNCLPNLIRDYDRRNRGSWFGRAEMKGFGTRFPSGLTDLHDMGATVFVTTEKPPEGPRTASIRAYLWKSAEIVTLGEFGAYSTKVASDAVDALWRLSKEPAAA